MREQLAPIPRRPQSLRNMQTGVGIDFLLTGQFSGDGKPKPVAFPHPSAVATEIDGIRYVSLPTLINLKLASGMTNCPNGSWSVSGGLSMRVFCRAGVAKLGRLRTSNSSAWYGVKRFSDLPAYDAISPPSSLAPACPSRLDRKTVRRRHRTRQPVHSESHARSGSAW